MKNILLDKNRKVTYFGQLYSWFIPSHYLGAVDDYNKEKVMTTNKITLTTGINETAKIPPLKHFLYFSIRDIVY